MRSASARVSGSPPATTVRTEPGSGLLTSSASADGTPLTSVTVSRAGSVASASRSSATITVPPVASGRKSCVTDGSKQTDVDASIPRSSAAENTSASQRSRLTAFRCSTTTPLGRPVDPDV